MRSTNERAETRRQPRSWAVLLPLGAAAFVVSAVSALVASCSLIVDTDADQCQTTANCSAFPGRECVAGVCEAAACLSDTGCAAFPETVCNGGACGSLTCGGNADCTRLPGATCSGGTCAIVDAGSMSCTDNAGCAANGAHWICRKDTHVCVSLLSAECDTVIGDDTSDAAFLIGSILPTKGPDASTGMPIQSSIALAMGDFVSASNGLRPAPGTSASRPIVLVACNDDSDGATAVRAAKHLAEEVGVPAIVGAAFSGITITVATTVTIQDKVLLFSPSATSAAITDLADDGLVWRSSPSDTFQAAALTLYMSDIETRVRADLQVSSNAPINVAIVHKGDAYGLGLGVALESTLTFNGKKALDQLQSGHYTRLDYGNPDDPGTGAPTYAAQVTALLAFQPNVVFLFGTDESVTEIFEKVEAQWPTGASAPPRPRYVLSDGGEVSDLWTSIATAEAAGSPGATDLRTRVSGTVPGTNSEAYKAFLAAYESKFGKNPDPDVFGTAGAYDITYLLAYGAASLGATSITGTSLAASMSRLVPPGPAIKVGQDGINPAFTALTMPTGNIDFSGASGPLDFDLKTGEAPSDIQIWCIPAAAGGKAAAAKNSGYYYDASVAALAGGPPNWSCQ